MVSYWKKKMTERAYLTYGKEGQIQMRLDNEKYPIEHFPRGFLLGESVGKLKHYIKNQIFNYGWDNPDKVVQKLKGEVLDKIGEMMEERKLLVVPPEKMAISVREIWRVMMEIEKEFTGRKRQQLENLKKVLTFILQEDDGYKFRIQWLFSRMPFFAKWRKDYAKDFIKVLELMQEAEVVEDMKLRIRLLKIVLIKILEDKTIRRLFNKFFKELDWKKMKLTKGDKFHFRAKWFKVDYPFYEY